MRVVVMGTGGIGGYYGGRLAAAGADVFFVARGAHLAAMRKDGLRIRSVRGDALVHPIRGGEDPQEAGVADVVLVCTKAWDVDAAGRSIAPVVGAGTVILPFQNGIDIVDRLARHVPRGQVAGGAAYGVVNVASPGVIGHTTQTHRLIFGAFGAAHSPTLREFHALCVRSGFDAVLSDSIERVLWEKFLFICAYSGLTSFLRMPIGPILSEERSRRLFLDCMREIQSVARAKGVTLGDDVVAQQMTFAGSLEADATSSMQRDLDRGNRLEVETLNGVVCRMARELGIATPVNDAITAALKPLAQGEPDPAAYGSMW